MFNCDFKNQINSKLSTNVWMNKEIKFKQSILIKYQHYVNLWLYQCDT